MQIACDLDGVLADLVGAMTRHTRYRIEDFESFGDWDDPDRFYSEARRVWNDELIEIEPTESVVGPYTARLARDHDVDVVTSTVGNDDVIADWLDAQGVVYDEIVRPPDDAYKDVLDYDCFIDDNPHLAGDVPVQYIPDRPWNQSVRGTGEYLYYSYEDSYVESEGALNVNPFASDAPWVIRVTSIRDVINDLNRTERFK